MTDGGRLEKLRRYPLVFSFGGRRARLPLMVVVEDLANTSTCALGDFACALGGPDADILSGDRCTFAHITSRVEWVKSDKVARTLPDTLGGGSSALGGSLADVSGTPANVATGAALPGLLLSRLLLAGRLRRDRRLRRGLGLAVLTGGVLDAEGKCEREEHDRRFWE